MAFYSTVKFALHVFLVFGGGGGSSVRFSGIPREYGLNKQTPRLVKVTVLYLQCIQVHHCARGGPGTLGSKVSGQDGEYRKIVGMFFPSYR